MHHTADISHLHIHSVFPLSVYPYYLLTLQCFFNQRAIFHNTKTSYSLRFYAKLIVTIPAIILAGAYSAYSGTFAIRTTNQRNHFLLCYHVRKIIKYTNTICLFLYCIHSFCDTTIFSGKIWIYTMALQDLRTSIQNNSTDFRKRG